MSNSTTGIAVWNGPTALRHWVLATDRLRSSDELRALWRQLFRHDGIDPAGLDGAVLGCVVPDLVHAHVAVTSNLLGLAPLVVGPGVRTGVAIRTDNPREVGPDRIANAAAVSERYAEQTLVFDFSTALTVDVIGGDGAYLGAVIAPGLEVARDALAARTARLPRIALQTPDRAIGDNTVSGLQSGLVLGYVGLVEGLVERIVGEIGAARVVATGEAPWAAMLAELCPSVEAFDPLLTLDGLRLIHARSSRTAKSSRH